MKEPETHRCLLLGGGQDYLVVWWRHDGGRAVAPIRARHAPFRQLPDYFQAYLRYQPYSRLLLLRIYCGRILGGVLPAVPQVS
eukprot:07362_6